MFFRPNVEKLKAKRDVGALLKALHHRKPETRLQAVKALNEVGDRSATGPLIELMHDPVGYVRSHAAATLGTLKAHEALEVLLAALQDEHMDTRYSACEALGALGDPRAVAPLIATLENPQNEMIVIAAAVEALGNLGDLRAADSLLAFLQRLAYMTRNDEDRAFHGRTRVRMFHPVTDALKKIKAPEIAKRLVELLVLLDGSLPLNHESREWNLRLVCSVLIAQGPPAGPPLLAALESEQLSASIPGVLNVLGEIRFEPAVDYLASLVDGYLSTKAVLALQKFRSQRAIEPLMKVVRTKSFNTRFHAIDALGYIEHADALEALQSILCQEEDPKTKTLIEKGIERIGKALQ